MIKSYQSFCIVWFSLFCFPYRTFNLILQSVCKYCNRYLYFTDFEHKLDAFINLLRIKLITIGVFLLFVLYEACQWSIQIGSTNYVINCDDIAINAFSLLIPAMLRMNFSLLKAVLEVSLPRTSITIVFTLSNFVPISSDLTCQILIWWTSWESMVGGIQYCRALFHKQGGMGWNIVLVKHSRLLFHKLGLHLVTRLSSWKNFSTPM